jgi:hypothetical protein
LVLLAPEIETVAEMVAGTPGEEAAAGVINQVKLDVATLYTATTGATNAADTTVTQKIATALKDINTNIGSLLSVGCIKNPTLATSVTSKVQALTTEANAMLTEINAAAAATH